MLLLHGREPDFLTGDRLAQRLLGRGWSHDRTRPFGLTIARQPDRAFLPRSGDTREAHRGALESGAVASPVRPFQSPPKVGHIKDWDPLDSTQCKEIGVGAHDIVRPPGDCTLEELIVTWITTETERHCRLNELGPPAEEQQERARSDRTGAELFKHRGTTQDALDFGDDGFGR